MTTLKLTLLIISFIFHLLFVVYTIIEHMSRKALANEIARIIIVNILLYIIVLYLIPIGNKSVIINP